MTSEADVKQALDCVSLCTSVDILPNGYVRIETPFKYPDGSSIDVFIEPKNLLIPSRLSDLGQTTEWLLNFGIKLWNSQKRRKLMGDALSTYDAKISGGELYVDYDASSSLREAVIRLAQACLRTSDLMFTKRSSLQTPITEDIEELFDDASLPYVANDVVMGKYGKQINVDFSVQGRLSRSLILTMFPNSEAAAKNKSLDVFRKWHDLSERHENFVTIYDDKVNIYDKTDIDRIQEYAKLVPISDRSGILELVA